MRLNIVLASLLIIGSSIFPQTYLYKSTNTEIDDIKVLILLYKYKDAKSGTNLPTADGFKQKFISENSVIQKWLNEVSYGKSRITVCDVFGWKYFDRINDDLELEEELNTFISDHNIDLNKYDQIINIYNSESLDGSSASATVGKKDINGVMLGEISIPYRESYAEDIGNIEASTDFDEMYLHELGHTFGFGHSNSLSTENDSLKVEIYGDIFCAMGSGSLNHFRGRYKESIGWLDSASVLTITENGTYTINALEKHSGYRQARILLDKSEQQRYLYLEFRNGSGYNSSMLEDSDLKLNTRGLFVYGPGNVFGVQEDMTDSSEESDDWDIGENYLLDLMPDSAYVFTLTGSNEYKNDSIGLTVNQVNYTNTDSISFSVTLKYLSSFKGGQLPIEFMLGQNYPNPFNPSTKINYKLTEETQVKIEVYSITGRKVIELINEHQNSGQHDIQWNGIDTFGNIVPAGIYFYKIKAGDFTDYKKMTLIK